MHLIVRCYLVVASLRNIGNAVEHQSPLWAQLSTYNLGDVIFDPSFDAIVESTLLKHHVPALSIAVVDNGRITSKVSPHLLHHLRSTLLLATC